MTNAPPPPFTVRLGAAMAARGLNDTAVALAVGVSRQTVTGWRCGYRIPSPRQAEAIRKLLPGLEVPSRSQGRPRSAR